MLTDPSIQIDYGKIEQRDITAFDNRLIKKIEILNKHLRPADPDKLKVRIQQPKKSQYFVDLTLFNSVTIHTNGKGNNVGIALENAFTPLKENLLQQINKQKDIQIKSPRQVRSQTLNQAYGKLSKHIKKQNKQSFAKELIPLLDDLKQYIRRHLRYAHMVGMDKKKNITSQETLNSVVVKAYEKFETKPIDVSLEHWLFSIADNVLSNNLREEEFEQEHMEDWDEYVDKALAGMEETLVMSAEGSPELVENLDETEQSFGYQPEQFGFTVNYLENLSNKEQVERIMKALVKIPASKRKIFELYAVEGFTEEEIAKIHETSLLKVEELIVEVRNLIKSIL